MRHSIVSFLLLASAFTPGCSPQPAASASRQLREPAQPGEPRQQRQGIADTWAFAASIGVHCDETGPTPTCVAGDIEHGDYFEVTLADGCQTGDFTARVNAPAVLRNKIAPLDDRTIAEAKPADALCIRATGSIKQHPEYYYVVLQRPGESCVASGSTPAVPRCPTGWIDAEAVTTEISH